MNSKALLVEYYDSLSDQNFERTVDCYDIPSKLISLYGTFDCNSRESLRDIFLSISREWKEKNISPQIGYDQDKFIISKIQENIHLAHTTLENFTFGGKSVQRWNCTYVLRKDSDRWLISLATTDNKISLSSR